MSPLSLLAVTLAVITVVYFVGLYLKAVNRMKEQAISEVKAAEASGESMVMPEEFNNVSLGVGSGIKFGFGFGIGLFLAGILIVTVLTLFFGITLSTIIKSLV